MRRSFILLGVGAVALLAFGADLVSVSDAGHETSYLTAPVTRGDLLMTLQATGSLTARVTVAIGSEVSGQIAETLVDFNDTVTKGQILARIDPRSFGSRVREAEAALLVAEATVDMAVAARQRARARALQMQGQLAAADADIDRARVMVLDGKRAYDRAVQLERTLAQALIQEAEATFKAAEADLRAAEARREAVEQSLAAAEADQLGADADIRHAEASVQRQQALLDQARLEQERTVIRSPVDGVVLSRDVDRGQTVAASLEAPRLFTLAEDLAKMWVLATIDEADIGRVQVGQEADFTVDAFPGRVFAATVAEIRKAPRVVQNVVAYTVVLDTENPDLILLPGMTALVKLVTARVEDVVVIPNAALRFKPQGEALTAAGSAQGAMGGHGSTVWLLGEGGTPYPVEVEAGFSDARATELVGGSLEEGQQVVVGSAGAPRRPPFLARLLGGLT